MKVQPYLFFNGRCEEAIDFYKSMLGAEVLMLMRFKENPDRPPADVIPPALDDKIMHATLRIGETEVMASDGMGTGEPEFKGVTLSIAVSSEAEADRLFRALGDGGQVQMPIGKTFFSPRFGMVADRFGVSWMVITTPAA
jgi:PhnB protein